ncbi:MAG: V-type ATP synthase subunit D [Parachlamydiales bacterium]|jgi:V/A-type H+-transporting ATPase subunit D
MAEIKLTKNDLRNQQIRLAQLERYLPTLQLKKAMLQAQVQEARQEIEVLQNSYRQQHQKIESFSAVYSSFSNINYEQAAKIDKIHRRFENIAGIEVPYFEKIDFRPYEYGLFETPIWTDSAITGIRNLVSSSVAVDVAKEKKEILENELREVSIRVNLFEKILIPRALRNIKKIKVFLGDLQLAAVSQAKIAKTKIVKRQKKHLEVLVAGEDPDA